MLLRHSCNNEKTPLLLPSDFPVWETITLSKSIYTLLFPKLYLMVNTSHFKVVIIGGSYAGLSAAMALGRLFAKRFNNGQRPPLQPANAPFPQFYNPGRGKTSRDSRTRQRAGFEVQHRKIPKWRGCQWCKDYHRFYHCHRCKRGVHGAENYFCDPALKT